jgi:DNA-binding beta-propeller fold protein YncE
VAFDKRSRRAFAVNTGDNTVDVIDMSNPALPTRVGDPIDFSPYGSGVNSVDAQDGIVAVASEAFVKTDPGTVVFLDARTLAVLGQVTVGALPDMVTFTPDGEHLLVANEGEPNEDYSIDPEGSVSVADLRRGPGSATVRTAGFGQFVGQEDALRARGIRIFGRLKDGTPATAAQDLEPEYITVEGPRAYVALQEANAIAVLNIGQATIEALLPLGFKDHDKRIGGVAVNPLDPSDRDLGINIRPWPVYGMFMPDGIASLRVRGKVYLLSANEGDARLRPSADDIVPCPADDSDPDCEAGEFYGEGDLFNEEVRVGSSSYPLDAVAFPNAATLKNNANLGRLTVTNTLGRNASGTAFERIYAFGARSFSVWDPSAMSAEAPATGPNAGLVWDSGAQFEQITAAQYEDVFNTSNSNNNFDDRSDNKGPEPEGIAVGRVGPHEYAFIGLERIGGVMVYDVTDPRSPQFVQYINTRQFDLDPDAEANDSGPEGVEFVSAEDSPNGRPLLLVGNEISQSMVVFEITDLKTRRPGRP